VFYGLSVVALASLAVAASAANWTRFRGENGTGVSADSAPLPAEWGDEKNLKWSVDLPGDGKSCPIIVGNRVLLTAWTGTGPDDLVRHVLAFDRNTGKELWRKDVAPAVPDEPFQGNFQQNGYASHTPVTDGERLYVFFGVSGVTAYDLDGNVVWGPKSVGTEFNRMSWGSASSPILYKDMVILTAGAESNAMVALDKNTGEERWRQPADALGGIWSTPVVMDRGDGAQDLVVSVGGELWGLNPESGKTRWYAVAGEGEGIRLSAVVEGDLAIMLAERGGNAIAVRGGGKGDVTDTHVAWTKNYRGNIGTPVCHEGLMYWVANNQLNCVDAATGDVVYQERLQAPAAAGGQAAAASPADGGGQDRGGPGGARRGGRGGGRGGMGGQDYSSPIIADGKLYFARRNGEVYVFTTGREFEQLAVNKFAGEADYSASPAASDGQLFIRSSKKLYCIAVAE
jgi:outer membrane protein assembly factor BamB